MWVKAYCQNSKGEKLRINVYGGNAKSEESIRKFCLPYKLIRYKRIGAND